MATTTAPAALSSAHTTQGLAINDVESLIAEMSSLPTVAAFRLFLQRAQALITGLVYVSVLVFKPKNAHAIKDEKSSITKNDDGWRRQHGVEENNTGNKLNSKRKKGGNINRNGNSSTAAAGAAAVGENDYQGLLGITADGSDLEAWQRVNSALENQATCGLDWSNCCVYEIIDKERRKNKDGCVENGGGGGGVLLLASEPEYPLKSTAAFQAATKSIDGIICNEYDALQGPHYADWQQLATIHTAQSFASLPMYISTSTTASKSGGAGTLSTTNTLNKNPKDQLLVGVLTLASTDPHAFESSRLVWLLAMALAPLAAQLTYAEPALRFENFIGRVMPLFLKENYLKTTGRKKENRSAGSRIHVVSNLGSPTSTKKLSTVGSLKVRQNASQVHDKREFTHKEMYEFLLSLTSMIIVYVAFWHATLISSSSTESGGVGRGGGDGCLPILKFIAGADILRLAIKWVWYNAILPSQKQQQVKPPFSLSTCPETSPLVTVLKALGIFFTRAGLSILSGLHHLFFLPMSHCWMVLFVFNKVLGGIYLTSWQLAGPMLGFCWQMKTHMQSSFFSFTAENNNNKTWKIFDDIEGILVYLETIVLAAASAERVCTAGFEVEATSYECLAVVSGVQFALRQLVPPCMGILVILQRMRKLSSKKRGDE